MAEARSAVAFHFSITSQGVEWSVDRGAFRAVAGGLVRGAGQSLQRMNLRAMDKLHPLTPISVAVIEAALVGAHAYFGDWSGLVGKLTSVTSRALEAPYDQYAAVGLLGASAIVVLLYVHKAAVKTLLLRHGFMYEPLGKPTVSTKIQMTLLQLLIGRNPRLYSLQPYLPNLPVPAVKDTVKRFLRSVKPWMTEEQYNRVVQLANEFQQGPAARLQFYLHLKHLFSSNYISDWWESYIYLHGRSPIMVNSNFYCSDIMLQAAPTPHQAARAAQLVHHMLRVREMYERGTIKPLLLQGAVPLCSAQYLRPFNTTRVPGEVSDTLMHCDVSDHIVVFHAGRFFRVSLVDDFGHYFSPAALECAFDSILNDHWPPATDAETHLAALTAGERTAWARAQKRFFSRGVNRESLYAVETAAFFLSFDDVDYVYDPKDSSKLDAYSKACLHGRCFDRWFDKSVNLFISRNAHCGFNLEHSYADAPIAGYMAESVFADEYQMGYQSDGHNHGYAAVDRNVAPEPLVLQWHVVPELAKVIDAQLEIAQRVASDVDMRIQLFRHFGKGFIKVAKVSPDAFIQMALQLAYFRDQKKFCQTYESSMTRLYIHGRTETVRSCTLESATFVRAMQDESKASDEKIKLLRATCEYHQNLYRDAMTGKGIDRHIFGLYVVSRYLSVDSPFLKEVLGEPWRLSTSQTPYTQTGRKDILARLVNEPDALSPGGGFGPVSDDGYGVAYIVAGEDNIFFHVSSKHSCPTTSSIRFGGEIERAMLDIQALFTK